MSISEEAVVFFPFFITILFLQVCPLASFQQDCYQFEQRSATSNNTVIINPQEARNINFMKSWGGDSPRFYIRHVQVTHNVGPLQMEQLGKNPMWPLSFLSTKEPGQFLFCKLLVLGDILAPINLRIEDSKCIFSALKVQKKWNNFCHEK